MSISTILSLVLAGLKLINWMTDRIDKNKMREDVQAELIAQQMGELRARFARLETILASGAAATPEDQRKVLRDD